MGWNGAASIFVEKHLDLKNGDLLRPSSPNRSFKRPICGIFHVESDFWDYFALRGQLNGSLKRRMGKTGLKISPDLLEY